MSLLWDWKWGILHNWASRSGWITPMVVAGEATRRHSVDTLHCSTPVVQVWLTYCMHCGSPYPYPYPYPCPWKIQYACQLTLTLFLTCPQTQGSEDFREHYSACYQHPVWYPCRHDSQVTLPSFQCLAPPRTCCHWHHWGWSTNHLQRLQTCPNLCWTQIACPRCFWYD